MLRNFASFKTISLRRAALAVAVALIAATAFVGNTAPAGAFGFHGGSFRPHAGFGGFHHDFDHRFGFGGFHHDFDRRFGFGGLGFFPGYSYGYYADYDGCLRRVWGPHGWHLINVCY
jgi:hypothetical protein